MTALYAGLSITVGTIAGMIYGFFYFPTKQLSLKGSSKVFASFFFSGIVRYLLIMSLFYYILHTKTLSIILVLLSFLISFWTVIMKK